LKICYSRYFQWEGLLWSPWTMMLDARGGFSSSHVTVVVAEGDVGS
jgi:hypothetical protein